MRKKNIIGFLLAFVMLFSICTNSFVVFAEESGDAKEPAVENKIAGAEIVDNEKEFDEEKIEDPQEEVVVKEQVEPKKKVEKIQEFEKAEELKAQDSEEAIELGEEKISEAVGTPEGFDLRTINTIAKDKDGNYYGVKTYDNRDKNTDSFKIYYKITEAQYNEVAKDCFMLFKRADGGAFASNVVKISTSYIDAEDSGVEIIAGPIFTEIQFRNHSAYDAGFLLNNSPLKVRGQEKLLWYIKLKKDWRVERDPKFYDESGWCYAFVNFNVVLDGDGHTISRNDDQQKGILWAGFGTNGLGAEERTATIKNLTIDGSDRYCCVMVSEKGVLNLENVTIQNGYADKNYKNFGGAIKLDPEAKLTMDASTTIKDCKANMGGAIRLLGKNTLTINGSTLSNNQADLGGAICTTKDDCAISITGATFDGNKAVKTITGEYLQGGAIYTNSPLYISGTTFKNNFANKNGGAIASFADVEINGGTFSDNFAGKYGGAVYSSANKLDIKGTTFENNGMFETEKGKYITSQGGAIYANTKLNIDESKFENNISRFGGAIISYEDAAIKKSNFSDNTAHNGGALYIFRSAKANISDAKFTKNIAFGEGGAIFTNSHQYEDPITDNDAYKNLTTSEDTVFKGNWALSGFFDPPSNYSKFTDLKFKRNSFTDNLPDKSVAKSLLNNYDVNYKNNKLSAFFDPNEGEFKEGKNPKDIRVIKDEKDKEIKLLAAPKRDGYKFTGWKLSMNIPKDKLKEIPEETLKLLKEGKIFKAGDNFKLDADYIFVAQWEKDDTPASPSKPEPKPETKPEPEPEIKFKKHEYVETFPVITKLAEKDNIYSHIRYLFGYPDDTIKPEGNMTRAEAVAVVTRLEGYSFKDESEKIFKDLKKGAWYNKYINAAFEKGILVEKEGQAFRPDEAITRAEFAKLISFIDADNSKIAPFPDVKGHVYEDAINKAYGNDRIKGYPDGSFRPDAKITRAEIVTILNNFYDRKADDKSLENVENIKMLKHFKDLKEDYWAYYEITEAANSHKFTRRSKGLAENWVHLIEDLEK